MTKNKLRKELEAKLLVSIEGVLKKFSSKATTKTRKNSLAAAHTLAKKFNRHLKAEQEESKKTKPKPAPVAAKARPKAKAKK
jgi:hypothetical protein